MTIDFETEYNNRARVPEHPDIIARWEREAAAYRAEAKAELDLAYGDSERSKVDLFLPESERAGVPLFVFIHGGYWQGLDRKPFSHLARGLNERGFAVAVPSYDLCPDTSVGAIIEQMRQCCLWLWRRRGQSLIVYGHSAGGHLTAAMLATDWSEIDPSAPQRLVIAGAPISGVFAVEPLCQTTMNKALKLTPEAARAASPSGWPPPVGTRVAAFVGGDESAEFHRQSAALAEVWSSAGVAITTASLPGYNHFTVVDAFADPAGHTVEILATMAEG